MVLWSSAIFSGLFTESSQFTYRHVMALFVSTRGLALLAGEPSVDDDVYRYLWDGAQLLTAGQPYAAAPIAQFSEALPQELSWLADRLNHPELATVYGPIWLMLGALGWLLSPTSLIGWRLVTIGFEFLLVTVVKRDLDTRFILALLTCPLWFWEIHLQCHAEGFGVGLWLIAVLAMRRGQFVWSGFLLALAVGGRWSMALPIALACFSCRATSTSRTRLILGAAVGVLPLGLMVWTIGPFDLTGLKALSDNWVFNPIVWKWFPQQPSMVWVLTLGVLLMLNSKPWEYQIDSLEVWTSLFAVWVLVSPVINPWYLLWLVPGMIAGQAVTWWSIWLSVIPIAYLQAQWMGDLNHPHGLHHHPDLVWWLQALAMMGAGIVSEVKRRFSLRVDSPKRTQSG